MDNEKINLEYNPLSAQPKNKKILSLIALWAFVFINILRSSTMSTILPTAALEIGGTEFYSLGSTAGSMVGIIAMPLFGYFASKDSRNRYRLMILAMLMAALGMFLNATAQSIFVMFLGYAMCGVCSGGIYICGYTLMRDLFGPEKSGYYLGICSTMTMIGMLVGPMIGGFLIDYVSWRAVCHVIWPLFLLAAIVASMGVKITKEEAEKMPHNSEQTFDVSGAIGLIMFLTCFLVAFSLGYSFIPFGSTASWIVIACSVIGLCILIRSIKIKGNASVVPAPALKNANVKWLFLANFISYIGHIPIYFFIPTFILYVMGGTATEASIPITLFSIIGIPLGPILGKWAGRQGSVRGLSVLGGCVRTATMLVFALFLNENSSIWLIYIVMFFCGVWNCETGLTAFAGSQLMLKEDVRVPGTSVINVGMDLGTAFATAFMNMIMVQFGVAGGMRIAMWVCVLCGVGEALFSLQFRSIKELEEHEAKKAAKKTAKAAAN